jgi:1-deoxy-D-xylulose-5-phosphate reductoisomerase
MKTKICILGSTGSIGKTTLKIIKNNKKKYKIILLTANKNIKLLQKQALEFNVKNLIVFNKIKYEKLKKNKQLHKINIYNNIKSFKKIFNKNKIDYTMSAITGFYGLEPTLKIIKFSKEIAIANKESIICGWNLIEREIKKNNTKFVPIDSEHFSIWSLLDKKKNKNLEKVFITASGGPFVNLPLIKFNKIKPHNAVKHPNWKMGKKISIDSSTLMNKVFEVIEAKKIFKIDIKKFEVLIHRDSYLHAIVKFNNGLSKFLVHDTNMTVPIFNSLKDLKYKKLKTKKLNIRKINNFKLEKVNIKRFPVINILKTIPKKSSLFETVLVSANDELVDLFLKKRIKYLDISENIIKILNLKKFAKYKHISPKNYKQIFDLNKYVRLQTNTFSV